MLNERNTLLEDDGIEEEILVEEECSVAQAVWGDIQGNIENQTDLQNALDAKQDSLTEAQLSAVNSGITAGKVATYDGYADQIASKADQSALNAETIARGEADTALGTRIDNEALARQSADNGLQSQIDAITSKSDVVDVVANYAALQAYDTSTLGNNDVVKVLDDETHEDALTYYRWSTTTQTWSYIGQEAPYYSKGQMDVKLAEKQDKLTAGANIQIQNGTISATDTTYTAGNGLNLNGTEFSADTDVLATKEDLEDYYTKPETDNLLAPKLEAEVVAELPTTGAEGKLYLTPKAHTTQTATGNPIEATVTEQAGQLESFQLDGDTFQQSYEGKNLFNKDSANVLVAYIDAAVSAITANSQNRLIWIPCEPNTTYTVSRQRTSGGQKQLAYTTQEPAVGVQVYGKVNWTADSTECSITTGEDARYLVVRIWQAVQESDISLDNLLKLVQIEKSSSATSYEPFVGGQPSPNPSYPQPIQTVTGLQTISINGTDYPLDLGSIELCKLGTYQDYIWKDGEEWKVHKETKRILVDGSQRTGNITQYGFAQIRIDSEALYVSAPPVSYCSNLSSHDIYDSLPKTYAIRSSSTQCNLRLYFTPQLENFNAYLDWCAENKPSVVAPLQQSVHADTTITDTALIAQLEAIRTASLQNGANTITNTATGSNLAGDMGIGYYGFAPRNRYDKWLWLDINNEYEQLNNPDTSSTLSTLSTRTLGTTTEQPTVTRSLETETITLKKGETEPIEDKTELPTILDEEAEETETTEPEESDGTDER